MVASSPPGVSSGSTARAGDCERADEVVQVDVVIVGAGWTGLATAAALRAYGVKSFALIEAGDGPAAFWEGNYDRIRLHTPWHSLPCDGGAALYRYPMFKPKRQVVSYLQDYFELHKLQPYARFRERVVRVAQLGLGSWSVQTRAEEGTASRRYLCGHVAICTSKLRVPYEPEVPGRGDFRGRLLHSRAFTSGRSFAGEDVLVVGSGNSGAEIASDLVEQGARGVTMLVHGPRLFIPLPRLGRSAWLGRIFGLISEETTYGDWQLDRGTDAFLDSMRKKDRLTASLSSDLSAFGIATPSVGFYEGCVRGGRIGTFDQGAISMIRRGRIGVKKAKLSKLSADRAHFDDGTSMKVDAVVLATGFQPRLEDFVAEPERFLKSGQEGKGTGLAYLTPLTDGRCRSVVDDSLFFVGFDHAINGGLSMGFWGWSCGFLIAQGLGLLPQSAKFSLEWLPERQRDVVRKASLRAAAKASLAVAITGLLAALWLPRHRSVRAIAGGS